MSLGSVTRSRSDHDLPVNLCQTVLFSEGQGSWAQLLPFEVKVLAKRRQISAGGPLRAKLPRPAVINAEGATGWGRGRVSSSDCTPGGRPLPFGCRDRVEAEVHCCLKAWAVARGCPGEGSGAPQDRGLSLVPRLAWGPMSFGGPRGEVQDLPLASPGAWQPPLSPTIGWILL